MDSISEINNKLTEVKDKRRQLILSVLDGRTQKSISDKTGIEEPRLSKWINGVGELPAHELHTLSKLLGVEFK